MKQTAEASARTYLESASPVQPHPSAMRERFSWVMEFVARRVFSNLVIHDSSVDRIRSLSQKGTVVYVLRRRSFVDYILLNYVLRRERLPLPVFANGISATLIAPFSVILGRLRDKLFRRAGASDEGSDHDYCARAVAQRRPVLIFMRAPRTGTGIGRFFRRSQSHRVGGEYLREIVHSIRSDETEKYVTPVALFRGHSFRRREPGISALVYSVQETPSDMRKLVEYWWNRNDLFISVGKEVDVRDFVGRYDDDPEERIVRRMVRALQIFLHREERVVLGPSLLPRRRVKALVLENEEMTIGIRQISEDDHVSVGRLRKDAERIFDEMAADFNGVLFGIISYVFKKIWGKMFQAVVPIGFEQVIEKVRHNPVVMVPCHRSHFDYLILTYLFHLRFVSPPHIAAGVNMSFWPMGPLFRAAGAFFIRRTFADDQLYKLVFRQYLKFLIREGYTQEFFIEGGRSRTGKIMTPKLGMLGAIVNAYLSGIRRDLYLVPVSIHYGRVVEEDSYQRELLGADKEKESFRGLLSARRFLKQRFGTVYVSFAEPISLHDALGDRKQRFNEGAGVAEVEAEKDKFIQKLGFRILREVNEVSVGGATSISATVLLGAPHSGRRYETFVRHANALATLAQAQGITLTASLKRNVGTFRESLGFLTECKLVEIIRRGPDEIIVIPQVKRMALDFYKNNLIHAFLVPSLATFCLLRGISEEDLEQKVWWWLELFRFEFALPDREELGPLVQGFIDYARGEEAIGPGGIDRRHPLVAATSVVLDNFRESYWVTGRTLRDTLTDEPMTERALIDEVRKAADAALLVGEITKPEAVSTVTFKNALRRFEEMGFVEAEKKGKREPTLKRGSNFHAIRELTEDLRKTLASQVDE